MKIQFTVKYLDGHESQIFDEFSLSEEIRQKAIELVKLPNVIDVKYYIYKGEIESGYTLRQAAEAIRKYTTVGNGIGTREIVSKYHDEACDHATQYIKDAEKFYGTSYTGRNNNIIELAEYLKEYMNTLLNDILYVFEKAHISVKAGVPEVFIRNNFKKAMKIAEKYTEETGTLHQLVERIKQYPKILEYIDYIIYSYHRIIGNPYKGFEGGDVNEYIRENTFKALEYGDTIYSWMRWYLDIECEGTTLCAYAENIRKHIDDLVEVMWDAMGVSDYTIEDTY